MPYSVRDVRRTLTRKLSFEEDTGRRHPTFMLRHGGRIVAVTHISHASSGDDVSDRVLAAMARQLRVGGPVFRGAITCAVPAESFIIAVVDAAERAS